MKPILNLLMALSCEAKPLIDHFRLRKCSDTSFPLFISHNEQLDYQINLLVSGIGPLNMAAACGWLMAKQQSKQAVWLNVGTAGHRSLKVGSLVRVVACSGEDGVKTHYPPLIAKWSGESVALLSYKQACCDYPQEEAVDMEAAAFFAIGKKAATAELVQSLKVISDNNEKDMEALNAQKISDLIAPQVPQIVAYVDDLLQLTSSDLQAQFDLTHLHCTVAQNHQFMDLQRKLQNIGYSAEAVQDLVDDAKTMRDLLNDLRQTQLQTAPVLDALKS